MLNPALKGTLSANQCRVLQGARYSVLGECVATYSGRLAVARVYIRQCSSGKLLS